ncbi:Tat pathway signal protein [Halovenus rubra]|uniref:Tat pathway signal protein n=2 Tax=Halovenus rubra TaxID=869890 RepID=A0ACC7E323_9EURY|nr:Tat pathway signal protein [Halovenus rubra]
MGLPDPSTLSRRDYLRALVAAGGTAALAACVDAPGDTSVPAGDPTERPPRQHAWNGVLRADDDGNPQSPEHHVLLALELSATITQETREQVEMALRSLESAYAYDPAGLLFTVGYTSSYFERVGSDSPVPEPETMTTLESPEFDDFDAIVHLASDNPEVVLEAEEALFGEVSPNGAKMDATFEGVFERGEPRRTGFIGPGLPAEHTDMPEVPDSIPEDAPFFMGFRSGFAESQAPESRVTIQEGPYSGGTTTHIESLTLQLETWFEQDNHFQRVAKLFSPEHAMDERVGEIGKKLERETGVAGEIAERTEQDARELGTVGHAQKAARERDEDGAPPLLRRDFNTTDNGTPGVHFLAHQRRIADFARVRQAMAGEDIAGEGVGKRLNNGILQYVFVRRRGNFIIPPRDNRALPAD